MKITIDYKQAHGDFALALANALNLDITEVEVIVTPPKALIPFCAEYKVTNKCADVVAKVKSKVLLLNIV